MSEIEQSFDPNDSERDFRYMLFASYFDDDTPPFERVVTGVTALPIVIGASVPPVPAFDVSALYASTQLELFEGNLG